MDIQEDSLGLYQVPNIAFDTIVKWLRRSHQDELEALTIVWDNAMMGLAI